MKQRWWVSLVVSVVMLLTMMPGITVLSANQTDEQVNTAASERNIKYLILIWEMQI